MAGRDELRAINPPLPQGVHTVASGEPQVPWTTEDLLTADQAQTRANACEKCTTLMSPRYLPEARCPQRIQAGRLTQRFCV